ncbi:MAG TPA: aminomethyl-transferring glycine dehydrogenase subunit GcvPA [Anaerolineaceae bacterium]|nr:aminomethyl-transferring glycine dehydrogenase subunit GcvPA [Anaerolineaceae bacterium]HPN50820.1 aminomethyl-transferring glycine dehydrogenase subunit GcvPA [Anaerolineaceae bacterium]
MFTPHTETEKKEMLNAIGVQKLADLFQDVPAKYRFPHLNLPDPLTEMEVAAEVGHFASANESTRDLVSFLGAGAYHHYIPAAVDSLLRRGEFFTAYTPYQPEISQGTLQAIFEYQSLIAALTGMDVSNASHYDGATAAAEAVIMAYHNFRGKRPRMVLSPSLNPQYRATLRTYTQGYNLDLVGDGKDADLFAGPDGLISLIDNNTALVMVQYPDFFGRVYDYTQLAKKAHEMGALVCVAINPTALGLFKSPGEMGADIVIGEGQPLGIPLSFGGPYLGIFAVRKEFARKISGRLVGESVDSRGNRAFVLTLTAREQHIRREKASSNICSNQGLMALASTIYMSLLGKQGFRQMAELCYHKAHYAAEKLAAIPGYSLCFNSIYFHEFVVCCPKPVAEINEHLLEHGIIGGFDLSEEYPSLPNHMLLAVTEMNSREEIDLLCEVLAEVSHE